MYGQNIHSTVVFYFLNCKQPQQKCKVYVVVIIFDTVSFPLVRLDLNTVGHRDCLALVVRGVIQALGTMEF